MNLAPAAAHSRSLLDERARKDAHLVDQQKFLHWLFIEAGLDASCYRPETLHRRIPACLRELRVANLADARTLLTRDPSRLPAAVGALLIGVTSFFRDDSVFQ